MSYASPADASQNRTKILAFMTLSLFLAYLPWYSFSAILKPISDEFHLTAVDTGLVLSAYQAGYVIAVTTTGWLADRIGAKKIILYATFLTAVSSASFIWLAIDKWTILLLRLAIGCASGAIYVPGLTLLSRWFPPAKRGRALGAYTGGLVAAYAGSYFIASPMAVNYGWRIGTLATSIPAFVGLIVIYLWVQERPSLDLPREFDRISERIHEGYFGYRPILITLAYLGHMWELYAFWGWIGAFMVASANSVGIPSNEAVVLGNHLAAFMVLVGVPAVWIGGMAADRIGRTKSILISSVCSLVPQFFFGQLMGLTLIVPTIVGLWVGFWVIADSAIYKAGLTQMVSQRITATALAMQSAVGFGITILAPAVFGDILERYNGKVAPLEASIWGPSFAALGVGALLAPIATLILWRLERRTP